MHGPRSFAGALREITPPTVRSGWRTIDGDDAGLHDDERGAIAGAVDRRRREFASGRALLRELMQTDAAIVPSPTRAPTSPPGWCCTLAHDDEVAVAAATDDPAVAAVGIDVEAVDSIGPDEASIVLRPDEVDIDPTLAFVVKEAVYKAWSGTGGPMLDHHDVRVELGGGCFRAVVLGEHPIGGRYARAGDRWLALAVIERSDTVRR